LRFGSQQSLSIAQNDGWPSGSKFEQAHEFSTHSPEQHWLLDWQVAFTNPQQPASAVSAAVAEPIVEPLSDEQPAPNVSAKDATARSSLEVCMMRRILRSGRRVKLG
jgi:hypothetical protein